MEHIAEGQNNTIVLPNKSIDSLGNLPAIGALVQKESTKHSN